jgi:hypothetical protein
MMGSKDLTPIVVIADHILKGCVKTIVPSSSNTARDAYLMPPRDVLILRLTDALKDALISLDIDSRYCDPSFAGHFVFEYLASTAPTESEWRAEVEERERQMKRED